MICNLTHMGFSSIDTIIMGFTLYAANVSLKESNLKEAIKSISIMLPFPADIIYTSFKKFQNPLESLKELYYYGEIEDLHHNDEPPRYE